MFLLDSNVYIHAFNNASFGDEFRDFHRRHLPRIVLSVVVIHELLIGAMTPARERSLRRGLIDPFKMRRRIHIPTQPTWELAAKVDRRLRQTKSFKSSLLQRSFFNEILIAVSARDLGATILTENERDFSMIAEALDIRFSKPWP